MKHVIKDSMVVTHGNDKGETLSVLNVVVSYTDEEENTTEIVLEFPPEATEEEIQAVVVETGNDLPGYILQTERTVKKSFFNQLCDKKIEEGFISSNGHKYRTNRDDQINMMGQKSELDEDATITEVPWKTEDEGYIVHTREEWLLVYREAFLHKKSHLFRYDELKRIIDTLEDIQEIRNLSW